MSGLKPFRHIPATIVEWTKWMREQSIPDPVSDTIMTGSGRFLGVSPLSISFETNEDSADYIVFIDGGVNETFWVTKKSVTGFFIRSSNATSTALVSWVLIR